MEPIFLRLIRLLSPASSSSPHVCGTLRLSGFGSRHTRCYSRTDDSLNEVKRQRQDAKWLSLPPFTPIFNGAELGKVLSDHRSEAKCEVGATSTTTSALKWVLRCCPELPRSLVQKLFRLRRVRRESAAVEDKTLETQEHKHRLKRVTAKDTLNLGDRIFLPVSVKETPQDRHESGITAAEVNFIQSLVLHKDPAILVLNKPPGMPVQGGIRINQSLDEVAAACLTYEYSESPRLHAITEYRLIGSSSHGYSWLELLPLTGRKHQLRVHCAEVLGTPIVGDYKYGWQSHRRWKHFDVLDEDLNEDERTLPFGLNMNKGSISEKHPRLHLHCKHIVLPNVSQALQDLESSSTHDLGNIESLEFVAPLPSYMQRSWELTKS